MKIALKYSALVIGVLSVLFLLLMASDTFETGISWYSIAGFLVQSIPALVIAGALVFGYFRPGSGSVVFLIIAVAFTIYFRTFTNVLNFMVISFPPLIISILLLVSSIKNRINR